jgi:hypothetical protein
LDAGRRDLTLHAGDRDAGRSARGRKRGTVLVAFLCVLLVSCFVVPFVPGVPKEELVKTSLWGLAALAASAGWGTSIAQRCWPRERVGLSLRIVWGMSAFAFVGGVGAMVSGLSKALILVWLVAGALLLARSWVGAREAIAREAGARIRAVRSNVPLAAVVFFLGAAVLARYLAGASDITSNPYDDDLAYYPFAKQLLESGTMIDPFSFRRMSTLGGQALYHALLLIRVQPLHLNLFDRGMCFVVAVGLLASHRVGGRRAPLLARLVSVAVLIVLPNTSINSASYYSGLAFFLAFFQTLERLPASTFAAPRAAVRRLLPLTLVGAALCTLRQNYQATVALVLVCSYSLAALRLRKQALRPVLIEGAVCLALVALLVAPWLVLSYRSSATFLFPLMKGTLRAGVDLQSHGMTPMRLVRFFADVWLAPDPITTLPLFMLIGLFVRETSVRRPLAAQWLAAFVSLILLSLAFSLSNPENLARYDYGFVTASAFLTWQTVATQAAGRARANAFGWAAPVALLLLAMAAPVLSKDNQVRSKKMIAAGLADTDELLRRTAPMQKEPPAADAYHRMQAATPPGTRMLVMLDEPYFLDFGRNEIWNLDMPGAASPQPGIPAFQGPQALVDYLRAQGLRYVAFVRPERSVYLYRRDVWFDHIYDPDEIWRTFAPYMVDIMDNLVALAATRVALYEGSGMILLDLEQQR